MSSNEASRITPYDLSEIRGQYQARRALEIAAAGGHGLLLIGPPQSTKATLALRLPGLLPKSREGTPCLRAPHSSIGVEAMLGGPDDDKPGEWGHADVLLLVDAPKFGQAVLEGLGKALESEPTTSYSPHRATSRPRRPQLVATMTPYPCQDTVDSERAIERHRTRIARYLGTHLEIVAETKPTSSQKGHPAGETTQAVGARVLQARKRRAERIEQFGENDDIDEKASRMARRGVHRMGLVEGRETVVRRIARTIADLEGCTQVSVIHVAEALFYQRGTAIE